MAFLSNRTKHIKTELKPNFMSNPKTPRLIVVRWVIKCELFTYIITTEVSPFLCHTHFSLKKMEKNSLQSYKLVPLLTFSLALFLTTELSLLTPARALDNNSKACNANKFFPIC